MANIDDYTPPQQPPQDPPVDQYDEYNERRGDGSVWNVRYNKQTGQYSDRQISPAPEPEKPTIDRTYKGQGYSGPGYEQPQPPAPGANPYGPNEPFPKIPASRYSPDYEANPRQSPYPYVPPRAGGLGGAPTAIDLGGYDKNNPNDQQWWREFKAEHQGMDPISYYMQPNNRKPGQDESPEGALRAAMMDRHFGEQLVRETGRPPTYNDYIANYSMERQQNTPGVWRGLVGRMGQYFPGNPYFRGGGGGGGGGGYQGGGGGQPPRSIDPYLGIPPPEERVPFGNNKFAWESFMNWHNQEFPQAGKK